MQKFHVLQYIHAVSVAKLLACETCSYYWSMLYVTLQQFLRPVFIVQQNRPTAIKNWMGKFQRWFQSAKKTVRGWGGGYAAKHDL